MVLGFIWSMGGLSTACPILDWSTGIWFYQCLGSPLASIVASLGCEALDKPLVVEREAQEKGSYMIELRVLN